MKAALSIIFNSTQSWCDRLNSLYYIYQDIRVRFKPFNENEWKDVKIDVIKLRPYTEQEILDISTYKTTKRKVDMKILNEYYLEKVNNNANL